MFVLIALPASIIPTFIAMYFMGFSLNLMTLMAMSLVVGILVDDSIVVLENTYRHMELGADRRKAALEGRNEIGFTALSITLVDVVVFLPLALAGGMIGSIPPGVLPCCRIFYPDESFCFFHHNPFTGQPFW